MTYPRMVLTTWTLAILLACLLAYDMAHASQWSLDLKGGIVSPIRTTPDGTYWQQPYPHNTRLITGAYGAGLNYTFTEAWSIQSHYLNLGKSRINGRANSDENYDHLNHRCTNNCTWSYNFRATDSLQGGDLTIAHTWGQDGLKPFLKGGVALLHHHSVFHNESGAEDHFTGWIPELELGAGLAYKWAYMELDYFQGMNFGGQNLPISTQQFALFAGVKIAAF